ncbi:IS110 family transposase [Erythrobacter sp. A30-3]|jgi:transposase|uniref:IS110 family transposase n=1 Tax=Croceicoccus sp. Ery15 TaxID=1703338 RepID=UPI0018C9234A|nr:IS110 family transposase [Croceicoccus sp. Ery15]QPL38743.1 IS110 family transposase [Erythrobacter sp. A30-3]QPL38802.1 IS110 family transposase [Erythrobacter sp. A30-3]QPL40690.1 IS110 family transposase [Erythrobacter sp. A30-3]
MHMLAIDLGKQSFHIYGISDDGEVVSRKVGRAKLVDAVTRLQPRLVAMEACASSHHWGRTFEALGHEVRLIHPRFVKPFVKGSKNDAVDAEAIFEAATRPTMRFVPLKSVEQQDLQALHRTRDRLVVQRTALINHTRGLLAEYGIVMPAGASRFRLKIDKMIETAELSDLAKPLFRQLVEEYRDLDTRVSALDDMLVKICRTDERCKRLTTLPGVGPIVATSLVAAIDDGQHFKSGRALSAWIGLVPRQYTTGGKPRLGGIGSRANHYLRRQLIHGARSALLRISKHEDRRSKWAQDLLSRAGHNKTLVAMANKTARMAWAILRSGESYKIA